MGQKMERNGAVRLEAENEMSESGKKKSIWTIIMPGVYIS